MGYKTTCNECGGHNFYITEQNHMGYCFNCSYTEHGTEQIIIKPSEHIPFFRELYTELTAYYHSCVDNARLYLHARGITDTLIDTYKIGYCPSSSHTLYLHPYAKESGITIQNKPFLADRITFPYWIQDKVCDIRGRAIGENERKYLGLFHSSKFRGALFGFNANPKANIDVITEGEIKAILGSLSDYTVRALPGIRSNRKTSIYLSEKQVICFDNQKKHKRDVDLAIDKLARRLTNPFIATLPLRGKEKQDIDSYILDFGIESFNAVIRAAIPYDVWRQYR